MFQHWFMDYASYVILERAIPIIEDGLKPVQRRIIYALKEIEDGRLHKVANIIGNTMQYHPHGDASISDAIVHLGQKNLLIETQGNWGDIRTGDSAAAPRYIEARLSPFALETAFNNHITPWQPSYDGRKKEPISLPVKFPLLLTQGAEGIAVGMATKIMPHNFCELINASIRVLTDKKITLLPDFPTGGIADFSQYNDGLKGGKIRVRAKIDIVSNEQLLIREIPFGITTQNLINSIVKANSSGKIKVKKIIDNTAKNLAIEIHLFSEQSPEIAIKTLYAFTDCEIVISPNSCVIIEGKPQFLGVSKILEFNTQHTVNLLHKELEILKQTLTEKIFSSSLEKVFIEKHIYRALESATDWEEALDIIKKKLTHYEKDFYRTPVREDILKLTEIKIKHISKYTYSKSEKNLQDLSKQLKEVTKNLENLTVYATGYFKNLLKKYGKKRSRRTKIESFDAIDVTELAIDDSKLYVNRKEGFIGYALKKEEYVESCSRKNDIISLKKDGSFIITKISDKIFVGKNIIYVHVFNKKATEKVYNMVYVNAKTGISRIKRFFIKRVTRNKNYCLTMGDKNDRILYFSATYIEKIEKINVRLSPYCRAHNKIFSYDFSQLAIKHRNVQGNILTKYPIRKIQPKK